MADPASGTPRFERDLRTLRVERGISLEHVQQQTRIPADVLDRFENGRLVGDPSFNEVYLKALLGAYAEAVGLAPAKVLAGYEAQKAGVYDGRIVGGGTAPPPSTPPTTDPEAEQEVGGAVDPETPPEPRPEPPREAPTAPPAVTAMRTVQETTSPTSAPQRPTKTRVVSRESITSSTTSIDASWGLIIGGSLIAILVLGGILWLMLRPDGPVPDQAAQTAQLTEEEAPEVEAEPQEPPAIGQAPQLQTPISVRIVAEDRSLQGFRVTAEPDVRRPYWIEQGEGETFESESAVILWGEESGGGYAIPTATRVEFQGFAWTPQTSPLTIDQERGQALLDSLHQAQSQGF